MANGAIEKMNRWSNGLNRTIDSIKQGKKIWQQIWYFSVKWSGNAHMLLTLPPEQKYIIEYVWLNPLLHRQTNLRSTHIGISIWTALKKSNKATNITLPMNSLKCVKFYAFIWKIYRPALKLKMLYLIYFN